MSISCGGSGGKNNVGLGGGGGALTKLFPFVCFFALCRSNKSTQEAEVVGRSVSRASLRVSMQWESPNSFTPTLRVSTTPGR